jgi:hypothetical protein
LEEVLNAYGAILVHSVFHASVSLPDLVRVATSARITVEVVLAATNSADPTLVAMEHLFLNALVVPEVARLAKVSSEHL